MDRLDLTSCRTQHVAPVIPVILTNRRRPFLACFDHSLMLLCPAEALTITAELVSLLDLVPEIQAEKSLCRRSTARESLASRWEHNIVQMRD